MHDTILIGNTQNTWEINGVEARIVIVIDTIICPVQRVHLNKIVECSKGCRNACLDFEAILWSKQKNAKTSF
jgi:hypothetical protein